MNDARKTDNYPTDLRHYSRETVTAVHSREQRDRPDYKPFGLWISVDNCEQNWRSWCESESYAPERLTVVHDVRLAHDARILKLSTDLDLLMFTDEYGADMYPEKPNLRSCVGIDWRRVAQQWQGIIISPYIWSMRLDERTYWYYGWDCASGCVWDANAIASVAVMEAA